MSNMVFVRHAQASLFEADYDRLSELGRIQASQLGEFFTRSNLRFDEVYVGPRRRHRQTAELVIQRAIGSGRELVELPELDEHQVDRLATEHVDRLTPKFPALQKLHTDFRSAHDRLEREKSFARLFETIAGLWLANRCEHFGVESWSEFTARVNQGINSIVHSGGRRRQVLVITSAGAIAVALLRALRCPDEVALGLGWRIWNCSLSQFAFTGDRFSLDHFNSMSHILDRQSWTYR